MRGLTIVSVALLTVLTVYRLVTGLSLPPARWDEQTNLSVLRETTAARSFPVFTYGGMPFFEKPPLWYGINLLINRTGGISPVSIRLLSVLAGFGVVVLTVGLVWVRYGGIPGLVTWISVLVSEQLFVRNAGGLFSTHTLSSADPDSLLLFFLMAVCVSVTHYRTRRSASVAGIATAAAVLTKGPLGFLPLLVVTALGTPGYGYLKTAWSIAVLLIVPWHAYMTATYGKPFVDEYVTYHLLARGITALEGHRGPVWHYVSLLTRPGVYPLFPVSAGLGVWLVTQWKSLPFADRFILLLTGTYLAVITLVQTKLAWYVLPVYPLLAVVNGMAVRRLLSGGISRQPVRAKKRSLPV